VNDESKNHQQNPVSETSVASIAAAYSSDAVWYQLLTGASCESAAVLRVSY
jgi:hypothetical protein